MSAGVDLILLGGRGQVEWPLGSVHAVASTVQAVHEVVERRLGNSSADAWLFWDAALGDPAPEAVARALELPGHVFHAGLRLGLGGAPRAIDFVSPTWILNRDPQTDVEATSWRLSLRAALVPTAVLREMGAVRPEYQTLDCAALEMGHRYIMRGVLMRHVPWLVPAEAPAAPPAIPFEDELRFLYQRFGGFWSRWAVGRAVLSGYTSIGAATSCSGRVFGAGRPADPAPFHDESRATGASLDAPRVTVLIPTIERYPYLRIILGQMREQTVKPFEIIVVDQTPKAERDTSIAAEFADLPLRVIYLEQSGQCSSRNAGLQIAGGDYILFMDDDNEVGPDLLEKHLCNLLRYRAEVSCGASHEVGAGPLPENFTYTRASDVFSTNNSLIRRTVLERSGLFDLAYDRGQRADGDLGMRIYLSGALMVLNPSISVLHHHAPRGGLRVHKARVITYASSRNKLFHRQLPSVTEMYLGQRYFNARQQRESNWMQALGTLSGRGGAARRILKLLIGILCLPSTCLSVNERQREAAGLMKRFPQIPHLEGSKS